MVSKIENLPNIPVLNIPELIFSETEVSERIKLYIDSFSKSNIGIPRAGLIDFFKLVENVIKTKQKFENIATDKRLLFLTEDPEEVINTEAITFDLIDRKPGLMKQGSVQSDGIREVIPHLRETIPHPEHINEKIVTFGQFFDNIIVFNIYSRTNINALNRVLWFEGLINSFKWYFSAHGINRVIELNVGKKEIVIITNLKLIKYPIFYFVRTEDISTFTTQQLKQIAIKVDI